MNVLNALYSISTGSEKFNQVDKYKLCRPNHLFTTKRAFARLSTESATGNQSGRTPQIQRQNVDE